MAFKVRPASRNYGCSGCSNAFCTHNFMNALRMHKEGATGTQKLYVEQILRKWNIYVDNIGLLAVHSCTTA